MDKKDIVLAEAEEAIARIKLNIATGKKRMINLQFEKEELEKSFPQWEQEILKYEEQISQIKRSDNTKENK